MLERVLGCLRRNGLGRVNDLKNLESLTLKEYGITLPVESLESFLKYAKQHPTKFINYCELVILPDGRVIRVKTSHTVIKEALASEVAGKSVAEALNNDYGLYEECVDYLSESMSVWYVGSERPFLGRTEAQEYVLNKLKENKLIRE